MKVLVVLFFITLLELVVVSVVDVKSKKIANKWSLFNLALFVLALALMGFEASLVGKQVLLPLGVMVLGIALYGVGVMGAGDSKLLASLLLIFPWSYQLWALEGLVYVTLIGASGLIGLRVLGNLKKSKQLFFVQDWKGLWKLISSQTPYSPFILGSWVWLGVGIFTGKLN